VGAFYIGASFLRNIGDCGRCPHPAEALPLHSATLVVSRCACSRRGSKPLRLRRTHPGRFAALLGLRLRSGA